ncbi:ATP-binding protein [Ferribacterium limneticum]|uniref:ATP-binding protein n=1 Tax=Ferribacterium limneticum TaxID=76259 RepID=UPI001CF91719|nr:ATP-binding protein [Ferribacterium limneticum]UCV26623.1 response regulator [Ferribacterium limneticum]UCV30540.1 response regulator [Ferribacterium limneticum]
MFGLFNWRSLQTRIAVGTLFVVLGILWTTVIALSQLLNRDMEKTISAQQFSTVSLIASEIDRSILERLSIAESVASSLTADILRSPAATQRLLEERKIPERFFNRGIIVTDSQGTAIADSPAEHGRTGTNYAEFDFIAKVLSTGVRQISDPVFSPNGGMPVFTMVVPILNADHKTIGLVIGVTNLALPNFLDEIGSAKYGNTGDFLVTAPAKRLFVASSDKRRVMKAGPPPGINPVYDRYIGGYEGSGVAKSSRGVVELSSNKKIASTGWLMQAVLPVDEAFAPIHAMERHLIVVSLLLTLVATFASWWWLRLQLRPLSETATQLRQMRDGEIPRQALPVVRQDEIGLLTEALNGLQAVIINEEAKAAEHAANDRLRRIVSYVPGIVFQYRLFPDGHSAFPFASEGIRKIYGLAPEEVETHVRPLRDMMHPDDVEHFQATMHESAKTLAPWHVDYRICVPDKGTRWLMINAQPERDSDGSTLWHGFIADISEMKAMSAELEHYRDHLEQLVELRTADLEAARAEAVRLAMAKSEFLAKMSHEIRTPLHGVLGMAHIGSRNTAEGSKARDAFAKITHSGNLLLGIINDILDFSKMEAGMLKIESTDVDLVSILNESIELMQDRANAKKLALQLRVAENLPAHCRSDSLRLRQILLNLLSNAVKFTSSGSVTLDASLDGEQLVFKVSDTGIGITREQSAKIFNPFEQGDNSTTRRFGGTGLGLAITSHLVKLMDGSIQLDSTPDSGSCFEVRLPYLPVVSAHTASTPVITVATAPKPLSGMRLLVAEDVDVNQEIMEAILRDDGADVVIAGNGQEAVELIRQKGAAAFDLVLMDIQMPVMNGHDAAREILRIAPDLPIVGQTAHALSDEREACFASGMVAHIAKPIDPDKLLATILKHVRPKPEPRQ